MTLSQNRANLEQRDLYPSTRFMGSKRKLLDDIWAVASQFQYDTAVDLFAGSGVVSYMFKANGARVISNDHMHMSWQYTKAMVENNQRRLSNSAVERLLHDTGKSDRFVEETFPGVYFTDEENRLIELSRFLSNRKCRTKRE